MNAVAAILIVDDEPAILRFLEPALSAAGYRVTSATTVSDAVRAIAGRPPDLVILDLGLPDGDGKDVIRKVREWSSVPIIVLSAREREAEKIEAFDLGADDYVNKPFSIGELMARIRAALRHRSRTAENKPVVRLGDLEIDQARHQASRLGESIKLTRKEFDLLALLANNAGKVMTHKQILSSIWGPAHTEDTQYLRVYIQHLRRKVETDPSDPKLILTETGIGYRLVDQQT
jgi:two-component system KDP operon response regulator KdpE